MSTADDESLSHPDHHALDQKLKLLDIVKHIWRWPERVFAPGPAYPLGLRVQHKTAVTINPASGAKELHVHTNSHQPGTPPVLLNEATRIVNDWASFTIMGSGGWCTTAPLPAEEPPQHPPEPQVKARVRLAPPPGPRGLALDGVPGSEAEEP